MNYAKLLQRIEQHVESFYQQHTDARLVFHTFSESEELVAHARQIAKHYELDERTEFIISAAAWFQYTGFLITREQTYQVKSAELAEVFLQNAGIPEEDINEIKNSIVATKNPQPPISVAGKILCDAVTFYLGTTKFKDKQRLLRRELGAIKNKRIETDEWIAEKIKMLEAHQYHTDYCKTLLNKTKEQHLRRLKSKQMERRLDNTKSMPLNNPTAGDFPNENRRRSQETALADRKPTRGVETMFRISSSNSQKISVMADNKAHIMISVNSIIMSVTLGLIVGRFEEYVRVIVPTIILLLVNVATIIYSILATRPKVTRGTFTEEDVKDKSVNLLFYGSFYNMDFKSYESGMRQMMNDREFLYGNLIKDIYWQGKVLGRKYKYLHISYNIFMYGIAISVLAFTITAILNR
ncbi:MAG: Phosphohydrolase [Segetibacter sp.]|jgi:predicted metal-dependent HD superfamily phosphohydrolase|nr:Phosphohydrolase [Segetibacter sp.]